MVYEQYAPFTSYFNVEYMMDDSYSILYIFKNIIRTRGVVEEVRLTCGLG